jgi:hypothetical protein
MVPLLAWLHEDLAIMQDLFFNLESSSIATWLRESNTIWAYPMVLTLHTVGLALLVGANTTLDLRLLGFGRSIPLAVMARSFRVMWIGFWINAASGALLFVADATTKGSTRLFAMKLALVMLGVVVIVATRRAVFTPGVDVDRAGVTGLAKALAALSLVIWVTAIAAGRLMAYV